MLDIIAIWHAIPHVAQNKTRFSVHVNNLDQQWRRRLFPLRRAILIVAHLRSTCLMTELNNLCLLIRNNKEQWFYIYIYNIYMIDSVLSDSGLCDNFWRSCAIGYWQTTTILYFFLFFKENIKKFIKKSISL